MERSQINGHDSLEFMLITEINQHKNILVLINNVGASAVFYISVFRSAGHQFCVVSM